MPQADEVRSLLNLAERDWEILLVLKDAERVHLSGVAFHAQQLVEKALKAVLAAQSLPFDRTHDLIRLARLLQESGVVLPVDLDDLNRLNPYAVVFRYDDTDIETITRTQACDLAGTIRDWAVELATTPQENKREQP